MKPPLPERLATALLIELATGNYRERGRFLSRRDIIHQWKVSSLTASRSLETLHDWGLLRPAQRSGHYLREGFRQRAMVRLRSAPASPLRASRDWGHKARHILHESVPLKRIAVIILSNDVNPDQARRSVELLDHIAALTFSQSAKAIFTAATDKKVAVDFHLDDGREQTRRHLMTEIRESSVQGVIILKRILTASATPLARDLIKLGLPVVTAFDDCEGIRMWSVNFNNVAIGHTAAKALIDAGHTRIGVALPARTENPFYFQDRLLGCELAARENLSEKIEIVPITVRDHPDGVDKQARNHFSPTNPERITGLFSTSVPLLPVLYPILQHFRLVIPRDLSAIVCSTTPDIPPFSLPFDTIRLDFERIGEEAFRILEAVYEGDPHEKTHLIDSSLETRGSVAQPFHISSRLWSKPIV